MPAMPGKLYIPGWLAYGVSWIFVETNGAKPGFFRLPPGLDCAATKVDTDPRHAGMDRFDGGMASGSGAACCIAMGVRK